MKEKNGEHPWGDTGQIIALFIFLAVWIADSFLFNLSFNLSNRIPLIIRLSVAILLFTPVYYLVRSGHQAVDRNRMGNFVVTSGAFRTIRHPLYLGSLLTYLALFASTLSLFSLIVWIGIFLFYNYIASYEEKLLEIKYGRQYLDYKGKTGKWIPRPVHLFGFRYSRQTPVQ
jgi:protein-S-isoprenylcysteine O-methyltransferase Ste14